MKSARSQTDSMQEAKERFQAQYLATRRNARAPADAKAELAGERWSSVQRVESVLISVLSLLDDAEVSSPANVDAGVMLRTNKEAYKERVREDKEKSKDDIPAGFEMPTHETAFKKEEKVDNFSWSDSEAEDDFGGSESDEEMFDDDDTDEQEEEEED